MTDEPAQLTIEEIKAQFKAIIEGKSPGRNYITFLDYDKIMSITKEIAQDIMYLQEFYQKMPATAKKIIDPANLYGKELPQHLNNAELNAAMLVRMIISELSGGLLYPNLDEYYTKVGLPIDFPTEVQIREAHPKASEEEIKRLIAD